ncbi:restriction endonuclease subunit S [Leptospira sp. 2 VSF19]|uniref:Restriction endonuclease subunit S n=1 Tax=Leptospira soteropolitanensis TaxID=2950025 RepID=A0AAW5VNC9_9LEPT|nr:restriction endonuclease subunit S [Leptospira soteropolitanensis]MCW7493562.1 restriction endonuclease subunit S [Leptospira soteropolitanensis]MCW7500907.1 restriction endonuclease subunit S [Leptospira soteropolitanensis]MCW7523413.1 restriction endonuclease subunit S [Leptospira soteropolitanensis]MCW7527274.1 restriction endonuclease subunit S [Leptospira soteropolitanensis]MCW7531131.1 restriction endonuclease subunit S [Leptospira soteropolitanensis]
MARVIKSFEGIHGKAVQGVGLGMDKLETPNLFIDKSNWTKVKLGDVAFEPKETVKDLVTEGIEHVVGLEHIDSEDIHLRRSAGIEESTTFTKKFSKGDVLFGRRRAYLKKAAQANFDGICSSDITVIRAKKNLLAELLPFVMNNDKFFDYAIKHSAGGLSPRVKFKDLANYEFLLPPKDQQAELAELLWAMDEVIEMNLACLGKIKLNRNLIFTNLVNMCEGIEKPFSDLLILKKGRSVNPHQRDKYIGLEHVDSGAFDCEKYSNASEAESSCNIVDAGDLCYSKLRPYLDKAFIASFDAISTTEILVYDTKEISKEYALQHLHSENFILYAKGKAFGTKMPRVSNEIVGKYFIKVLKDESILLSKMKTISEAELKLKSKITTSKSLQKSLLNQVF